MTARVVSGEARVVLSWTAPANTGGAPITGYKIEASDDGSTSWTEVYTTTGDAIRAKVKPSSGYINAAKTL